MLLNSKSNMLKLVSVNIEGELHIDLITSFLEKEMPDVVALQEVFEADFQDFKNKLGMNGVFAPMAIVPQFKTLMLCCDSKHLH